MICHMILCDGMEEKMEKYVKSIDDIEDGKINNVTFTKHLILEEIHKLENIFKMLSSVENSSDVEIYEAISYHNDMDVEIVNARSCPYSSAYRLTRKMMSMESRYEKIVYEDKQRKYTGELYAYSMVKVINAISTNINRTLDIIFDTFDILLVGGNYEACDNVLFNIVVHADNIDSVVGALTITADWSEHLKNRSIVYDKLKEVVEKKYDSKEAADILRGLE